MQDVAYFISQGVNVNATDDSGWTALHHAAAHNPDIEVARFLIQRGANVNAADKNGITPLHVAAKFSPDEKMVILLIENRADVNAQDNKGETPLDCTDSGVVKAKQKQTILSGAGGKYGWSFEGPYNPDYKSPFEDIFIAAEKGSVKDVWYFLAQGVEVNVKSERYDRFKNIEIDCLFWLFCVGIPDGEAAWTPLHFAASGNPNIEVLEYLIAKGADVNAENRTRHNTVTSCHS